MEFTKRQEHTAFDGGHKTGQGQKGHAARAERGQCHANAIPDFSPSREPGNKLIKRTHAAAESERWRIAITETGQTRVLPE